MTQTQLAEALKISQPMVSRSVRAGMPKDLEGAIAWRKINLDNHLTVDRRRSRHPRHKAAATPRADPPPRDAGLVNWRDRLDAARAAMAELDLAGLRGELLPADEVQATWEKGLGVFRSRSLSIPSRCAALVPAAMREAVFEILTREIHAALTELAGGESEDTAPASEGNGHA